MLSNAYFLANFRFDTAENEPAKNLQKLLIFPILLTLTPYPEGPDLAARVSLRPSAASSRASMPSTPSFAAVSKIGKFCKMFAKFANFWRARSRLYQNEILQENMRSTAFFKLYKICILLHRCNLNFFAKKRFEKTAIFVKFQQKNCKYRKIYKILPNFKNFSLRIW